MQLHNAIKTAFVDRVEKVLGRPCICYPHGTPTHGYQRCKKRNCNCFLSHKDFKQYNGICFGDRFDSGRHWQHCARVGAAAAAAAAVARVLHPQPPQRRGKRETSLRRFGCAAVGGPVVEGGCGASQGFALEASVVDGALAEVTRSGT